MLYDYQVAIGLSPTGMHFPFCGNLVSLHFCISDVYIVVECRGGANKKTNKQINAGRAPPAGIAFYAADKLKKRAEKVNQRIVI